MKTKKTFGTVNVNQIRGQASKAVNMILSFEESAKLSIALEAALMNLSTFDHRTKDGKRAGINLCLFPDEKRITVNPAKTTA